MTGNRPAARQRRSVMVVTFHRTASSSGVSKVGLSGLSLRVFLAGLVATSGELFDVLIGADRHSQRSLSFAIVTSG